MNPAAPSTLAAEVPAYAQLQREMHDALLVQHPEWILPNGDCPTCDSYDARFAQLLTGSLVTERARDPVSFSTPAAYAEASHMFFPETAWASSR